MRKNLASIVIAFMSLNASANENLFDMSLTELLAVEVTTVSKKAEPLVSAPGVVTVVTREEILAFGGRHIKDVLQRLPNLYIFDSPTFVATGVNLRSGATQHLNNRVLYLINGRPLRESQNGGLHTDVHLLMPIELLERIEMIRGPGSVLYGSNAFNGTINFITRTPENENTDIEVTAYTSAENDSGVGGIISKTFDQDGSVLFSLNGVDDQGNRHSYYDERENLGEKYSYLEGYNLNLHASYKGWSVNGISNQLEIPIVSGSFDWQNLTSWQYSRNYLDVGYDVDLNEKWHASINTSINRSERDIAAGIRTATYYQATTTLIDGFVAGELTDDLNLVAGVNYEWLDGDLGAFGGNYSTTRTSVFGQLDYQYNKNSKLVLGLQWNDPDKDKSNVSPRLAYHHQFNNEWSGKLLYSEAFRTAYGSELFFDAVFLKGDKSLSPELIQTYEIQTTYGKNSFFSTVTLFSSHTEDGIGRARINGTVTFVNESITIETSGLEIEAGYDVTSDWTLNGSLSLQNSSNNSGLSDVTYGADNMFKLGARYIGATKFKLGIWYSYFGEANKMQTHNPLVLVYNPDASSFGLLSVNFESNLGELFDKPELTNTSISIYLNNIADEDVYYPDFSRKRINAVQQDHHQSAQFKIKVKF